jgi:hypothetical protein
LANDHTDLGADPVGELTGHGKPRHLQPMCPFRCH